MKSTAESSIADNMTQEKLKSRDLIDADSNQFSALRNANQYDEILLEFQTQLSSTKATRLINATLQQLEKPRGGRWTQGSRTEDFPHTI